MNTEEELLADALIEIISWVKSSPNDSIDKPMLVAEIISSGRVYLTFLYFVAISFFALSSYSLIKFLDKKTPFKFLDDSISIKKCLITCSIFCLLSLSWIIYLTEQLTKVYFAPRIYVIDLLTKIVIYES